MAKKEIIRVKIRSYDHTLADAAAEKIAELVAQNHQSDQAGRDENEQLAAPAMPEGISIFFSNASKG